MIDLPHCRVGKLYFDRCIGFAEVVFLWGLVRWVVSDSVKFTEFLFHIVVIFRVSYQVQDRDRGEYVVEDELVEIATRSCSSPFSMQVSSLVSNPRPLHRPDTNELDER